MTLTQSRVLQYIGIILICGILAGGYWYFHSQASTLNAPGGDPFTKGLVGYWKLDDGSGTTATDSSTNGNNGTLTNGPTWTTGQIGGAVQFDGSNDSIEISSVPALNGTFTYSAWINLNSTPGGTVSIADKGSNLRNLEILGGGYLSFWTGFNAQTTTTVSTSIWHHVVGLYDGTTTRLYVDGVLSNSATGTASSDSANTLSIGGFGGARYFPGKIDEVRIYSRALSADEISKLYNLTSPTGVDASLDAYWSFDGSNVSGTTLYDQSGRGKNGTLMNGVQVTQGKIGQALFFDGVDDRVNVATVATGTTFTITAWVRPQPGGPSYGQFFGENQDSCFEFHNANNKLTFDSGGSYNDSNTALPDNEWSFVGISVTAGSGTFYLNGNPDGTKTGISSHNYVDIGWNVGGEYFHGKIDELRFYGRALSQSEMQSLYQQGGVAKFNSSISQPQGTGKVFSGLVDYWRFDDGSGTTATDSGTGAHNGTLTGGGFTWGTGQVNGGLDTTGAGYISTADTSLANNSFTLSAWAKRTTSGTYDYIFAQGSSASTNNILQFGFRDSNVFMCAFYNNDLDTTGTYTDTNWHYWTCTYDAVSNLRSIYLDGVFLKSDTASADYQGSGAQQIGASFAGSLDEFRIYSRALSADEVRQIYNLTNPANPDSSLKGYWSFNGTDISGTTAYDRSGSGNNGTLTNGPTVVPGKVGQALSFDGTNYVGIPNINLANQSLSIAFWAKKNNAVNTRVAGIGNGGGNLVLQIDLASTGFYCGFYTSSTTVTIATDPSWHYWACTYDAITNTRSIYRDGVVLASEVIAADYSGGSNTFYFGRDGYGNIFSGQIDEPRVYNRALSASEIQTLYTQGNGSKENSSVSQPQGTGRLDSGLAGYWKLDDGSGTNATDSSTNGNNGTLTNGPTWTTGKIGGAVNFDASNDEISMGSSASTQDLALGPMSVSLWFNATETQNGDLIGRNDGNTINQGWAILYTQPSNRFTFAAECSTLNVYKHVTMPSANVWHHAVVTYDGSVNASGVSIYIDGALQAPVATQNCSGARGSDSSRSLKMGYTGYYGYYGGSLDEVRIYRRIVSPDEVRQLYNLTAPTGVDTSLKGYWSFNGQDISGTTAYDRSGAGNNGTLLNGLSVAPAKIGQGIKSNYPTSSNQGVSVSASASLNNLNQKTLSVWMYPKSTGASCLGTVYSKYYWSLGYTGCGGTLQFGQIFSTTNGNWNVTSTPTYNAWHLVTITYDDTSVANDPIIYIDGVPAALSETSTPAGTASSDVSSGIYIGNNTNSNGSFDGILDEFRIYNRILSASEVAALYNQGR